MQTTANAEGTSPVRPRSLGAGLYVPLISLAAATGGLLFGFDTAVISGSQKFFEVEFHLGASMTGWVVSSVLIGGMAGAALSGALSDSFGRKRILILSALLFAASAILCGISHSAVQLVVARLIGGIGIGIASTLSPLYIAEVSPPRVRGRLVAFQQLAIVTGILVAFFSNTLFLHTALSDAAKWRWMLAVAAFPSAVFLLLLLPIPESPRWLVKMGRREEGFGVLLRVTAGAEEAQAEMSQIEAALAQETGTFGELFARPLSRAMLIGLVLAILQQVCGINAIMYYAPRIFEASGAAASSAFSDTVWVGAVNLLFTLLGMALVDALGRRPLLLVGYAGMLLALVLVGAAFTLNLSGKWLLAPILAYVAFFAASTGVVTWVVISEIFPTRVRGRAMSIAIVALWAACYLVSQTFPILLKMAGPGPTFFGYGIMCAITVVFVFFAVPETKGRTLEEISESWA